MEIKITKAAVLKEKLVNLQKQYNEEEFIAQ